jgi:hypothetical protein
VITPACRRSGRNPHGHRADQYPEVAISSGNQALTRCAFPSTNPTDEPITSGLPVILEELKKSLLNNSFFLEKRAMHLLHSDDISCHGHLAMTNVLKRSGKLGMLLRDEFLTPLRYYK